MNIIEKLTEKKNIQLLYNLNVYRPVRFLLTYIKQNFRKI